MAGGTQLDLTSPPAALSGEAEEMVEEGYSVSRTLSFKENRVDANLREMWNGK